MRQGFVHFRRPRADAIFFGTSVLLILSGWLWAYFTLRGIEEPLIVRWSRDQGITGVGNLSHLARMGMLALVITAVNFSVAHALRDRDPFLGKLIAASTFTLAVLIFIGFAAIISVN